MYDYQKVLREIPGMELWVQTADKKGLESLLKTFPQDLRRRIKVVEVDSRITDIFYEDSLNRGRWTQDSSKPITSRIGEDPQTLVKANSRNATSFPLHQELIGDFGNKGHVSTIQSNLYFEGGNVIVGEKNIFVGSDIIQKTQSELKISKQEALAAYSAQFGKPVVEVGAGSISRVVGFSNQPAFHIDLSMAIVRDIPKKTEVAIVQSPSKIFEQVYGWPPIKTMEPTEFSVRSRNLIKTVEERVRKTGVPLTPQEKDFVALLTKKTYQDWQREEAMLTSIAKDLQSKGYKVERILGTSNQLPVKRVWNL